MAWASHILSRKASTSEQLAETRGEQLEILAGINRQIIQELQDGVMIVDETGRMLQSNLRAQALLGVDLAYGTPLQRIDPGLASRLAAWREQSPEHNQPFRAAATQRSLRPRFMSADRTHADYAVILLEDTGDIEQQAAQLKLAALGRLTASIAHEIRNPLSAITHASQLLREPDVPNTPRLLEIIEDNALRMDVLVQDVLNLSRRDRANPEAIPCKAYLQHFIEEFAAYEKVPDHGIRLDAAAGRTLSFDRAHLHQILWNLLRNAWRHCRRQAGSIRVHAAPAHTPGMIQIDVMDDGPGVPVELQSQLFEPFFTTESRGTGLGLYIARELAAANQATIEYVEHSPGGHFRLIAREVT
jgi:two-component system sensor histidine kinase PilS (NtrC family)